MKDYILSCCSTVDLSASHLKDLSVEYAPFHYYVNGKDFLDDLGKTVNYDKFYQDMVDGADVKTSQINAEEYYNYFYRFAKDGKDILHVTISSGISGSYNSACLAKVMLREEFPDIKIYIVDSLAASSGYGLLIDKAAHLKNEGYDIDALKEWIETNKLYLNHWFFSSDLTFYIKGGRISKTAGTIGSMLSICPLLNVSNEGKLVVRERLRGKKKVIKRIVAKMEELAQDGKEYSDKVYISNSACIEDAQAVSALIKEEFPNVREILINNIGTTIGSHTGPGTVALFFWGQKREN